MRGGGRQARLGRVVYSRRVGVGVEQAGWIRDHIIIGASRSSYQPAVGLLNYFWPGREAVGQKSCCCCGLMLYLANLGCGERPEKSNLAEKKKHSSFNWRGD